ncbi:MAG: chemotaxis protein CheW, partial [Comamonas sp.]
MLKTHAGRTYLVQSARCAGYQGYAGPEGWQALLMVPLDLAFSNTAEQGLQALDTKVAQGLLAHARQFSPALHAINAAASNIRRVVWNGQVMTAGRHVESAGLQAVLAQIAETGARTHEVFAQAIRALYNTVLATALQDSRLLTRLLVDLLDRNLY